MNDIYSQGDGDLDEPLRPEIVRLVNQIKQQKKFLSTVTNEWHGIGITVETTNQIEALTKKLLLTL